MEGWRDTSPRGRGALRPSRPIVSGSCRHRRIDEKMDGWRDRGDGGEDAEVAALYRLRPRRDSGATQLREKERGMMLGKRGVRVGGGKRRVGLWVDEQCLVVKDVTSSRTPCREAPPTFVIDPLECDGLLLSNAAHLPHLLVQLHEGYRGGQVCNQHVPGSAHTHTHTHTHTQ
ncbi:hypothetical protein EYF80_048478 [Liparis tanakae]|uniref:Uncharacterized protein n=1 Tax=Liparis tanakae TaxID=230148 RepID=A0A4Z2FJP1_9TELE|nr:hypothetical protein EYF80_048478 [Liparis tanakae]